MPGGDPFYRGDRRGVGDPGGADSPPSPYPPAVPTGLISSLSTWAPPAHPLAPSVEPPSGGDRAARDRAAGPPTTGDPRSLEPLAAAPTESPTTESPTTEPATAAAPGAGPAVTAAPGAGTPCPRCGWLLVAPPGTSVIACPRCHFSPEVPVNMAHSRFRSTHTTFGPLMRSVLTLIVLAPPIFDYWAAGPGGLTFCLEWMIFGVPVVLAVWAKGRVR
jgi:hypothetical protein